MDLAGLEPLTRLADIAHRDALAGIEGERDPGCGAELYIAVEIDPEAALVGGRDGDVGLLGQRLHDREVRPVDEIVGGTVGRAAKALGQPDRDVVGRAVRRPEAAWQRIVGVGAPAGRPAIGGMIEALGVEVEIDVGLEARPAAILVDVPGRGRRRELVPEGDAAFAVAIVVGPHPAENARCRSGPRCRGAGRRRGCSSD